jgi:hypothetical protein
MVSVAMSAPRHAPFSCSACRHGLKKRQDSRPQGEAARRAAQGMRVLKKRVAAAILQDRTTIKRGLMEAITTGMVQCMKCNTVYQPAIKVLESVCPMCLSIKTAPVPAEHARDAAATLR